jgi:hypothetical protein
MNNLPLELWVLSQLSGENTVRPLEPDRLHDYTGKPDCAERDTDDPCLAVEWGVALVSKLV